MKICRSIYVELNSSNLDRSLGLDSRDSDIYVFRNDISSIEQTTCHILAVSGITLHHLKQYRSLTLVGVYTIVDFLVSEVSCKEINIRRVATFIKVYRNLRFIDGFAHSAILKV